MNLCKRKKPIYHYFYLKCLNDENIIKLKEFLKKLDTSYEVYETYDENDMIHYKIGSDFYGSLEESLFENCYIIHKYSYKGDFHSFIILDDIDFNREFKKVKRKIF